MLAVPSTSDSQASKAEVLAARSALRGKAAVPAFNYTVMVTEPEEGESDVSVSISMPMAEAAIISYIGSSLFSGNIVATVTMRVEGSS